MFTKRAILSMAVILIAAALPGCGVGDPFADWADRDLAQRVRGFDAGLAPGSAAERERPSAASVLPAEEAGERWFVDGAVAHNPQIAAARQEVERRRARIAQVNALPDPTASVTFGELTQTAAGQVEYIVAVQQTLPFPGTLSARGDVARHEVAEAIAHLEATLRRVQADARRAYWSYFAATAEAGVLRDNRALLEQIAQAVQSRVRVNAASQNDLLRISRRTAALENRLSEAAQRRATAAAMLNRLMSRPTALPLPEPEAASSSEKDDAAAWDRNALVQAARRSSPSVRIARAAAQTWREKLGLAKVDRLPDWMLGVQYGAVRASGLSMAANGDDQVAGTVGVTIPLWADKYDAAEREALHGIGQALASLQAAQDRAAFEIDDALARCRAATEVLDRLRQRLMPDARQTIDVTRVAYENNRADLLDLLDDWEALLGDQLQEARTIADRRRALADLEQTLGSPPPAASVTAEDQE